MSARVQPAVWKKIIDQNGFTKESSGLASEDPFNILAQRAAHSQSAGQPIAHVTLSLNNAGEYGAPKVSVTLHVPVICGEADISLAGEAAYIKAHQMVNEASDALGLPLLP